MSRAQAHRHDALSFDDEHARLAREVADDGAIERMREGDHDVAALDQVELDFDHVVDGVAPEQPEHDHRHREGDADDGQRGCAADARQYCESSCIRRGVSALADSSASIQERRKRSGAAGRMATAGASATTFCNAVRTPSDAAARLIAEADERATTA